MLSSLEWIAKFAEFAVEKGVPMITNLVEQFADENPELKEPPPEDKQKEIDKNIDKLIADKFGK